MTEQDKAFYADGYRAGQQIVAKGINSANLYEGIQPIYKAINELISMLIKYGQQQNIAIDCKAGCSACCYQSIYGVEHEFDTLTQYLLKHWTLEEREQLVERARKKFEAMQVLSKEEQALFKSPCPFLKDGNCSVYEMRPMACRIYLSTSVESCKYELAHPEDKDAYPQLLDFPLRAGKMMNEGFVAALKVGGYKTREYRIDEGILAFRYALLEADKD